MIDLDIQRLLRSNEVKSINFSLEGARITGRGYDELSTCFATQANGRRIRVVTNAIHLRPSTLAAFDPYNDRLFVRGERVLATPGGRALVVHECTHAQADLRARSLGTRPDEAMARIAMAWYLLACGEHDVRGHVPRLQAELVELARTLRARAQRANGAPAVMTRDEILIARRHVPRSYANTTPASNNGIQGFRYTGP